VIDRSLIKSKIQNAKVEYHMYKCSGPSPLMRNRTFRSGRFDLGRSVTGHFGLALSVWGHFGHDISVHKQLIIFIYLNDYRHAKCHSSWCFTKRSGRHGGDLVG